MKKLIFTLITIAISINIFSQEKPEVQIDEAKGLKFLIGEIKYSDFEHELINSWFKNEYENYKPKQNVIEKLKQIQPATGNIFMATWCSDTQRELPRFFKIIDELGWDHENFKVYALDRKKNMKGIDVESFNIEYVPTFIFYDANNKEKGRIIEEPNLSLEEDLLQILTK